MEYETTVSLVFGGRLFHEIHELLRRRSHAEEDLDIYTCGASDVPDDEDTKGFKYRELKRYETPAPDGRRQKVTTLWDRKLVKHYTELQVPYLDPATRRVLFVTTNYKCSIEERLNEEQWERTVREDHTDTTTCLRVANKRRLSFPPDSFSDLFGGSVPEFTRLSLGEYSTYGGTLEARTRCNPVYYLEIEQEFHTALVGSEEIRRRAERLVETLFTVLPYSLVAETVRREAAATVQRERTDNVFDEFKRRFVNYNRWREELWKSASGAGASGTAVKHDQTTISLFVMPKWDGIKATASYCDGFLFVRDSYGSLATYTVRLPFDNDVILQLEVVKDTDTGETLLVVTEIMAVVVKSHDTLYHVYNRNNTLDDTGRYAGNVATSITLKSQFGDPNHRCNTYRLVEPLYSLLIFTRLASSPPDNAPPAAGSLAVNTYMRSDAPRLVFTTVAAAGTATELRNALRTLDRFYNYEANVRVRPKSADHERRNRQSCLETLSHYLPPALLDDPGFCKHCEGLLVAFVSHAGDRPSRQNRRQPGNSHHTPPPLPDHGYVKVKLVDTVDLEYDLATGLASSASGTHRFRVHGVPDKFAGWAERPRPIANDRAIIECYFDREEGRIVYVKDRPDKHKADGAEKITAIDCDIVPTCSLNEG